MKPVGRRKAPGVSVKTIVVESAKPMPVGVVVFAVAVAAGAAAPRN